MGHIIRINWNRIEIFITQRKQRIFHFEITDAKSFVANAPNDQRFLAEGSRSSCEGHVDFSEPHGHAS